jgi:hypothetical protein
LERAVIDDRFIPAAIERVTEFAEVEQAWLVFSAQYPGLVRGDPTLPAWVAAAGRLLDHGSGTELQRLDLLIDIYNELEGEALLPPLHRAIQELERKGIDGTDASKCSLVLEHVVSSMLPLALLDDAKRIVSAVIAKMLADFGGALALDEISSVGNTLCESGADQDAGGDAVREALSGYFGEMSSMLAEVTSLSELEEYERELQSVMHKFGVQDSRPIRRIESRREKLADEEGRDSGTYSGHNTKSSESISDDQIRSMFDGLRNQ